MEMIPICLELLQNATIQSSMLSMSMFSQSEVTIGSNTLKRFALKLEKEKEHKLKLLLKSLQSNKTTLFKESLRFNLKVFSQFVFQSLRNVKFLRLSASKICIRQIRSVQWSKCLLKRTRLECHQFLSRTYHPSILLLKLKQSAMRIFPIEPMISQPRTLWTVRPTCNSSWIYNLNKTWTIRE